MTPDKQMFKDFVLLILLSVLCLIWISAECTPSSHSTTIEDPHHSCALQILDLSPRQRAAIVHGSPRSKKPVSYSLAHWYCRNTTPDQTAFDIHHAQSINPNWHSGH